MNIAEVIPFFVCTFLLLVVGILSAYFAWHNQKREKNKYLAFVALLNKQEWGEEFTEKILDADIAVGMTPKMVIMAWGKPDFIDQQKETKTHTQERWVYGRPRTTVGANYVTFRDGEVIETHKNFKMPSKREPGLGIALVLVSALSLIFAFIGIIFSAVALFSVLAPTGK